MKTKRRGANSVLGALRVLLCVGATGSLSTLLSGCAGYPVTGASASGHDAAFAQSETAIAVGSAASETIVVVAYNDETDTTSTVIHTPTSRHVLPGANYMGWSYSTDAGKHWKYGGKVTMPSGIAALWGDPAATVSLRSKNLVFISNLAVSQRKMPATGFFGSAEGYIDGAVIARSTDGGKTFSFCQSLSRGGHFYDGGSMASSPGGEVYASFVDWDAQQIDVWKGIDEGCKFELLPAPFSGMVMSSHPRLRVDRSTGNLFVAAQAYSGVIYMSRWDGSSWTKPIQCSYSGVIDPNITFPSGMFVRTGPQFAFDVGASSSDGADAIRMLYTMSDPGSGRFYVRGSYGPTDMTGFRDAPEWGTTPGNLNTPGDQFNPNVKAWGGFFGLPPVWKVSYLDRDPAGGDTVTMQEGNLGYLSGPPPKRIFVPFPVIKRMPVCPDNRGYWGDYDDLEMIGFSPDSTTPTFIRTMSDSSLGSVKRWEYVSQHLHIRAGVFE